MRIVLALCTVLLAAVSTGALAQQKLALRLDWKPGGQHTPFYFAKERGYYAQEGIDLQIISGSGSSDSVKQLGTRSVDLAIVDALVLVQAAEQRVPVKAVAVYYQRTPIVLISPKVKPVTSVQQLTGDVKVGAGKASAVYQGLVAMLAANNLKPEQIKMVDIGFGVQPLLVKQVDALMGFTNVQPIELESAGMVAYEMFISDHGVSAYGLTISANDELIGRQPALITGFLRATKKAVQEIATARQAGVDAVVKAAPEISATREIKALERTFPLWVPKGGDVAGFGAQSEQGWQQTIDVARRVGLIEKATAPRSVYNASFL
ncbi:MAG: ABC transporter substrate-binding protein, partial [Alphaproteobacteria bacterium]|nr:ABC transporter substrate-binding protein [Alphaproteobacteria bacterium]